MSNVGLTVKVSKSYLKRAGQIGKVLAEKRDNSQYGSPMKVQIQFADATIWMWAADADAV